MKPLLSALSIVPQGWPCVSSEGNRSLAPVMQKSHSLDVPVRTETTIYAKIETQGSIKVQSTERERELRRNPKGRTFDVGGRNKVY
jgi:hypothetical protein